MKTKTTKQAEAFFYEHVDCCRYARELARAERLASDRGFSFEWQLDGMTNREWTDEGNEYGTWYCVCRDATGKALDSLCGIDFGEGGDPWGDPYHRVIEAELAAEACD